MSRAWTFVATCGAGALLVCKVAMGAAALPYGEQFSGSWSPTSDPWSAVQTEGTVSANTGSTALSGTYGVAISNASLTLSVAPNPSDQHTNVWLQVYAKPQAGASDPTITDNVTGAFYLKGDGSVRVLEANGATNRWISGGSIGTVDGNTWYGFLVHADYGAQKWELYYNAGYGTNYAKLVGNIGFGVSATNKLSSMTVECGQLTCVDAVAVTRAFGAVTASTPANVKPKEYAAPLSTNDFQLPVYSDIYTNSGENTLNGRLGKELGAAMHTGGDTLKVYGPVSQFTVYTWDNTANGWSGSATITPLTQMQLDVPGTGSKWGFYPYNTAMVVEGVENPLAPPLTVTNYLYGTLGGHNGYTALTWPGSTVAINDVAFPIHNPSASLVRGDLLFVETSTPGRYNQYWYELNAPNANKWMDGASQATRQVSTSQRMWLQRKTSDVSVPVQVTF